MFDAYFITHLFYGYDGKLLEGGAEIHLREIVNLLRTRGLRIKVIQTWYKNGIIYRDNTFEVEGVKISPNLMSVLMNFVWKKKVSNEATIIHLNDINLSFPFADKHVTVTFHGVGWDIPTNIPLNYAYALPKYFKVKTRLFRFYSISNMKHAVIKSKKILSVDSSLLRIVQHEFPEYREKITVIPNFVDTNVFRPTSSKKNEFGLNHDDFVILYPRNISLARGFPILLELIKYFTAKSERIKFLIAGKSLQEISHSAYFNVLKRNLDKIDTYKRVRFLGSVPHEQMWKVYNASDVVIIPSLFSEGTSLSAIEAMACGKPVVASNVGGLNDVVINGYNGLLVQPNAKEFTRAITSLYLDEELRKTISAKALEIAHKVYNKDRWQKQIIEFFDL
jgi:glycosyltransferase involved in cell wall biosynthesis